MYGRVVLLVHDLNAGRHVDGLDQLALLVEEYGNKTGMAATLSEAQVARVGQVAQPAQPVQPVQPATCWWSAWPRWPRSSSRTWPRRSAPRWRPRSARPSPRTCSCWWTLSCVAAPPRSSRSTATSTAWWTATRRAWPSRSTRDRLRVAQPAQPAQPATCPTCNLCNLLRDGRAVLLVLDLDAARHDDGVDLLGLLLAHDRLQAGRHYVEIGGASWTATFLLQLAQTIITGLGPSRVNHQWFKFFRFFKFQEIRGLTGLGRLWRRLKGQSRPKMQNWNVKIKIVTVKYNVTKQDWKTSQNNRKNALFCILHKEVISQFIVKHYKTRLKNFTCQCNYWYASHIFQIIFYYSKDNAVNNACNV